MSLKSSLYAYLVAQPAIASLVSDRVYPSFVGSMSAPLPYACYDQTGTRTEQSLAGPTLIQQSTITVQCWAANAPASDELAKQMRLTLDGYRGTMGDTDIRRIFYDSETDTIEVPGDGQSLPTYLRTVSFRIWHRSAT